MNSRLRVFRENEFEMALITYKRPFFVKEWLTKCLYDVIKCNIVMSIYDSSDDDETKRIVDGFNKDFKNYIRYVKLESKITGGYKYMPPIINTVCESIMIVGDSRCHLISDLNDTVFQFINREYDLIVLSYFNNEENDCRTYTDKTKLLSDCFIPITCCGFTIFKTTVFNSFRFDNHKRERLNGLYKNLYGFAYLGYYLDCYYENGHQALFAKCNWSELLPDKKRAYWKSQFYECWCDELCKIMDSLPKEYGDKNAVLKATWRKLGLDSFSKLVEVKKCNALHINDYIRMKKSGYLNRVTDRVFLFRFVAYLPLFIVLAVYNIYYFFKRRKTKK